MKKKDKRPTKMTIDTVPTPSSNVTADSMAKSIQDIIASGLGGEDYKKPEEVLAPRKAKRYRKSKVIFNSDRTMPGMSDVGDHYEKPLRRLRDKDLLDLASIDPYIAAIITTRVAQISSFGDKSESMFDKGIRCVDCNAPKEKDFESKEAYERECDRREKQKNAILNWALSCGTDDKTKLDQIYFGIDSTFKNCTLKSYLQAQTRSLLALGRCARQNLRLEDGTLVAFRPCPTESIKPVKAGHKVFLSHTAENEPQLQEVKEYNDLPEKQRPVAYIQEANGQQIGFFTDQDIHMSVYNTQAQLDLNGYMMSPIEFSLFLVYINQHSLAYLRNQFTKGMLNRCLINISSKDPDVELSQEDIGAFKRELQNMASRTENSSSIPIVAGPVEVTCIPLDVSARDMEWLQLSQAVIRSLCAAFQIAPSEVGYGLLGDAAGLSSGNKDYELVQGEERGLRILVDVLMEDINDAVYDNFPEAKDEGYKIVAVGIGSETREGMLTRLSQEQNLTATQNELLSQSEKNVSLAMGGDVPLSTLFHANVVKYLKYGEFREHFLGEEGASQKPEYDFIVDPNLNAAYQSAKTGGVEAMKAQNKMAVLQVDQATQQGATGGQPQQGQEDPSMKAAYDKKDRINKSLLAQWEEID